MEMIIIIWKLEQKYTWNPLIAFLRIEESRKMMYSSYDTVECTEILKPRDKWSKEVVKYDTLNTNTMNA